MFWFTQNNYKVFDLFMLKHKIKSKMSYSESGSDFGFAINSVSDFDSISDSDSESDSSSMFMNLDICIFLPCIYPLLNKLADGFLSILITESIVIQAMQV